MNNAVASTVSKKEAMKAVATPTEGEHLTGKWRNMTVEKKVVVTKQDEKTFIAQREMNAASLKEDLTTGTESLVDCRHFLLL